MNVESFVELFRVKISSFYGKEIDKSDIFVTVDDAVEFQYKKTFEQHLNVKVFCQLRLQKNTELIKHTWNHLNEDEIDKEIKLSLAKLKDAKNHVWEDIITREVELKDSIQHDHSDSMQIVVSNEVKLNKLQKLVQFIEKQRDSNFYLKNVLYKEVKRSEYIWSHGMNHFQKHISTNYQINITFYCDSVVDSLYNQYTRFHEIEWKQIALDVLRRKTILNLPRIDFSAKKVDAIFDSSIMVEFLKSLCAHFLGRKILLQKSLFFKKIRKSIFAKKINIFDNPFINHTFGKRFIDHEGVGTQRVNVIKNGVFSAIAFDQKSAAAYGAESTGHAKWNPTNGNAQSFHNFLIEPGRKDDQQLLQVVKDGPYLMGVENLNLDKDTLEFKGLFYGAYIQNGKAISSFKGLELKSDVTELLKNVSALGNKLKWKTHFASPHVYVKELDL